LSIFTLDDVHKAEAVLLSRLDDASTLLSLGSSTHSEIESGVAPVLIENDARKYLNYWSSARTGTEG
jgi:hypothetical protein